MRLLHLFAENFRSHAKVDLNLAGVQSAVIVGRNGGGKSSLLAMIEWCLFGTGSQDATMRRGQTRMAVQLDVHAAGRDWRIARGRDRKKAWLTLDAIENGESVDSLSCRTIAETQALIVSHVVGLDAEAFRATVYAPQGQAGMLSALPPARRKELLAGLLGLERWEQWRSAAALQARDESSLVASLTEQHDRIAGHIAEVEAALPDQAELDTAIEQAEQQLEQAEQQLTAAQNAMQAREQVALRASLIAQMRGLKQRSLAAGETARRLEQLDERLEQADDAAERFARAQSRKDDYDRRVAAARAEHDAQVREHQRAVRDEQQAAEQVERAARVAERAEAHLAKARAAVDGLAEHPSCPTCGQDVTDQALAKATSALQAAADEAEQAVERAAGEHTAAADAYARASAAVGAAPGAEPNVELGGHNPAAYDKLHALVAEHDRLRGARDAIDDPEDVDALRAEWERLHAQAALLPKEAPKAPSVEHARSAVAGAQRAVSDARAAHAGAAARRAQLEQSRGERDAVAAKLPDVKHRAQALGVLANAFSRNGIPALILDNATSALEAAANQALADLGGGMRIRVATQRTTRSGGLSETLDIMVSDGVDEVPVEVFSGGERYRVHIALRLGLAAALQAAEGRTAEALLIDEPTDLDHQGMTELGRLLARMPQQVLVVSHDSSLIDTLPTAIRVHRPVEPRAPSTVTVT